LQRRAEPFDIAQGNELAEWGFQQTIQKGAVAIYPGLRRRMQNIQLEVTTSLCQFHENYIFASEKRPISDIHISAFINMAAYLLCSL